MRRDGFTLLEVRDGFTLLEVRDGFTLLEVRDGFTLLEVRDGFTLLEVLVAFVIAALALGALLSGGLGGLQAATVAGRTLEALSRAQSHLAAAVATEPVLGSDRQGDEGRGYHWRVRISPVAVAPQEVGAGGAVLTLYAVSAAVSWAEGGRSRSVQVDTQRVAAAPPAPP